MHIFETEEVFKYLQKRNLLKQYKKAKEYLINGSYIQTNFKLREPKKEKIYYFRINKQFRALGKMDNNGNLVIGEINNHQN